MPKAAKRIMNNKVAFQEIVDKYGNRISPPKPGAKSQSGGRSKLNSLGYTESMALDAQPADDWDTYQVGDSAKHSRKSRS